MIKLINLRKPILTLGGKPIMEMGSPEKILNFKSALVSALEMHQIPGEGIQAYELGGRLIKAEDEIEISEEDLKFLKKIIESSSVFVSVVIGRLSDFLSATKERSINEQPNQSNK